jgi:hypothetical protein
MSAIRLAIAGLMPPENGTEVGQRREVDAEPEQHAGVRRGLVTPIGAHRRESEARPNATAPLGIVEPV